MARKSNTQAQENNEELEQIRLNASQQNELEALRQKLAESEAQKKALEEDLAKQKAGQPGNFEQEMINLRKQKQKDSLNEIKIKEIVPPLISLWHVSGHNVGKRVGPIPVDNAEGIFMNFAAKGIRLSMSKPTEAWIEEYKKSTEYAQAAKAEQKRREGKQRNSTKSKMDRFIEHIAKHQGIDVSDVTDIKKPEEVGVK